MPAVRQSTAFRTEERVEKRSACLDQMLLKLLVISYTEYSAFDFMGRMLYLVAMRLRI